MTASALCIFDAYGTLLDVHSAVRQHADRIGPDADAVSALWRAKQLEYSWVRSLMRRHRDFWKLTEEALDHALHCFGIDDGALRADLLGAYLDLAPYPEAADALRELRDNGIRSCVLSNGTPQMLEHALRSADLHELLDGCFSIEEAGIFKPDPSVYEIPLKKMNVAIQDATFHSSNAWDAAGAAAFGLNVFWINRSRHPAEYGDTRITEVADLSALPRMLGQRGAGQTTGL
ncbi:MAG: haloacid dehalogenase type II [Burkholderiales bacterium]